ncbi:BQ5605_C035g11456 [Microbotryum silenes-dioicae]|uniref:BQ5605_C035g11456 protein n=1 Tax=Microbotryum silenes-dioicae TaxID=796604 RepID=A0A2X0N1A7_9BASI|nr:BQ5605_C039g11750 [Microbotryum silenes-dioicae]SGY98305.1 BQ5605_C035g11456 [Microbotryum silenes-dioicae]
MGKDVPVLVDVADVDTDHFCLLQRPLREKQSKERCQNPIISDSLPILFTSHATISLLFCTPSIAYSLYAGSQRLIETRLTRWLASGLKSTRSASRFVCGDLLLQFRDLFCHLFFGEV